MSELHPIEAAWRLFRNSEAMPVFRKCLHRSEALVTQLGLAQLPAEVVLPGFVPFNLVPLLKGGRRSISATQKRRWAMS